MQIREEKMVLKDITIEQITQFCNKFDCGLGEFKPSFNGAYYLQMFTGAMGPQPEFHVTETSCIGINYYMNYDLTTQWLQFIEEINTKDQSI